MLLHYDHILGAFRENHCHGFNERVIPSGQRQAIIIWTTAVIVLIEPLGTNFSEI